MSRRPSERLFLWVALAIALSPSIREWSQHWLAFPHARSVFVGVFLLAAASWRSEGAAEGRRFGLALVALALALQAFALIAQLATPGRVAIAVGIVGLSAWLARPRLEVALLALWLVPVPHALLMRTGPLLDRWTLGFAGLPLRVTDGTGALSSLRHLPLALTPGELVVIGAHAFSAVGFFSGLLAGGSLWVCIRRSVFGALLGSAGVVLWTAVALQAVASGFSQLATTTLTPTFVTAVALAAAIVAGWRYRDASAAR